MRVVWGSKVLALTASPAGELTVLDTVKKIEELLDRLRADLVAPSEGLEEVSRSRWCLEFSAEASLPTGPPSLVGLLRRAWPASKWGRSGV